MTTDTAATLTQVLPILFIANYLSGHKLGMIVPLTLGMTLLAEAFLIGALIFQWTIRTEASTAIYVVLTLQLVMIFIAVMRNYVDSQYSSDERRS